MSKKLLLAMAISLPATLAAASDSGPSPESSSPYLRVQLDSDQPAFLALSVDSRGKGKVGPKPAADAGRERKDLHSYPCW